jgi:hypothetical protein
MMAPIMALDLASVSGWAVGEPGGKPVHGSIRFARAGASHEAIFASAFRWMNSMLLDHAPKLIVWEAPMPTSFKTTNINTTTLLYGLPAVIGAATYLRGGYDIRKADTRDVRHHFIGCNPKRAQAKPMVVQKCRAMGLPVSDDNEADALGVGGAIDILSQLAIWHCRVRTGRRYPPELTDAATTASCRRRQGSWQTIASFGTACRAF